MKTMTGALAACLLSAAAATAQTPISYTEGGRALFSFTVPDFWSVRTSGPREVGWPDSDEVSQVARVLAMQPTADNTVWMGFISPPNVRSFPEARTYMGEVGKFLALDATVGEPVLRRIGGRPAEVYRGTGRRYGRALSFTIALIELPRNRVAIGVAVMAAGADPGFVDEMNGVFASFRAR